MRPRKYSSPELFDAAVDKYVNECVEMDIPITITGMALHMGFVCKGAIYEYKDYEGFSESVKRARLIVENAYEVKLARGKVPPAGPIFALKNFGWADKLVVDNTSSDGTMSPTSLTKEELVEAAREVLDML